jgi:hypothetical protein
METPLRIDARAGDIGELDEFGVPIVDPEKPIAFFEFWPATVFYIPTAIYYAWLAIRHRSVSLPSIANPRIEAGGLWGESKMQLIEQLSPDLRRWVAPVAAVPLTDPREPIDAIVARAEAAIEEAGLDWPLVAKPDIACRGAGVQLLHAARDLRDYLRDFPKDQTMLLQKYVDAEGEAGVFFVRLPGETQGRVISLTLKYFPHVTGDGESTVRELIERDPRAGRIPQIYLPRHRRELNTVLPVGRRYRLAFSGNHCRGCIFRNGNHAITLAMTERFQELAAGLPEFYCGRFDVRFEKLSDLLEGHGFTVIEINGAGSEATHIWDREMTFAGAHAALRQQFRLLFEAGARNRRRGYKPIGLRGLWRYFLVHRRLNPNYPETH